MEFSKETREKTRAKGAEPREVKSWPGVHGQRGMGPGLRAHSPKGVKPGPGAHSPRGVRSWSGTHSPSRREARQGLKPGNPVWHRKPRLRGAQQETDFASK